MNSAEVQPALPSGMVPLTVDFEPKPAPPGWCWRLLTDLARLESGHTPSRDHPEWWGGDIPWIALPDIRALDGRIAFETSECTNDLGIANSSARVLPAGTVVLSRTASVGFVTVMGRPMATSQDFVNWVCGPYLDPDFLALLLRASRGYIRDLSSGAVHKTVYVPTVKAFRVCVPNPENQRRIRKNSSGLLETAAKMRIAAETRSRAAKLLASAYLRSVFDNPESRAWPPSRLGEVCELRPSKSIASDGDAEVIAITTACLSEGGFLPAGVKTACMRAIDAKECVVSAGEILVARSNTAELVGRAALFNDEVPGVVASDLTIRVWPGPRCHPSFLAGYLAYLYQTGYWIDRAGGASGSMKKITRSQIEGLPIPLPPLDEQRAISARLSEQMASVDRVCAALKGELAAISKMPKAILDRAFSA